jgi:hypothetical protein
MDKNLTDNEIIKALRGWLEEIRKSRQAYLEKVNEEHYPSMRYEYLLSDTIHEINRLQADCENYKQVAENQQKATMDRCFEIKRLKEKIERLQSISLRFLEEMRKWGNKNNIDTTNFSMIPILESENESLVKQIKAEAYKEFAERVKIRFSGTLQCSGWLIQKVAEDILKELVGEDNESKN